MKTFADVKRRLIPGMQLVCIENTLRPQLDTLVRTVTKVQTNGFWWIDGGMLEGKRAWTDFPKAAETRIVDADTFDLGLGISRDGTRHYVRLRFLTPSQQPLSS